MFSNISIETLNNEIANEEYILNIFENLLRKGIEPLDAYNYIEQKIGKEKLLEILGYLQEN